MAVMAKGNATGRAADEAASFDTPRPLRNVPNLPDGRTRRSLQKKLEARGLSEASAAAVARAVVRPDLAVGLLDAPTSYRVPGAELLVIRVEVFTSRVIADATNPRTLNDMLFPAAVPVGDQRALFPPLEPPVSGPNDFTIRVSSLEQLIWQLDMAMAATIRENNPRPSIAEQGIMEPPLAVPATVVNGGGDVLVGAVLIREGSTRVSHAQSILGLQALALVRQYVSDGPQRELIEALNSIAESSASTISEADAGRIRVATMPLDLVIGVEPDDGTQITLGEAVAAKVAQDHLNHKQEWKPAAKEVHLGEQCLIALHEESLLTDDVSAWLAGRFAADQKVDGSNVEEDDRWAQLLWLFTTRSRPHSHVIRRPIATVLERETGRKKVTNRGDRIPLAVALAMRSRRGLITDTAVEKESRLLENSVPPVVFDATWRPSRKSIEKLVEEAVEAAKNRTDKNAAAAELAARAIWYLAKNGQLSMPRNDLGVGGDRRMPAELTAGMLASERGVRQLGQAILDGRKGNRAGLIRDDAGTVDVSGVGTPVVLKDEEIRSVFVPRSGPPAPPPRDPRGEFMDGIARLGRALNAAQAANEELAAIDDGHGQPMVEVMGLPQPQYNDFKDLIDRLSSDIAAYMLNWSIAERVRQQSGSGSA